MSATKRRETIKKIVKTEQVKDQQSLVEILENSYDIIVNQSIVSRDLKYLGISKKNTDAGSFYYLPDEDVKDQILALSVVDVSCNEAMIVIKTVPGLAAFVGDYIDDNADDIVLGTISGENTVFVAPRCTKKMSAVHKKICSLLNF